MLKAGVPPSTLGAPTGAFLTVVLSGPRSAICALFPLAPSAIARVPGLDHLRSAHLRE
jgi:hypothetical protein